MPKRREDVFHCTCESCLLEGGHDSNGVPLGRTFPLSQREAHLVRVHAEAEARRQQTVQDIINSATSDLFVSTLLDKSPDLMEQPSRLWSSRNGFQSSKTISPTSAASLPVEAVVESLDRLGLGAGVTLEAVDHALHPPKPTPLNQGSISISAKVDDKRAQIIEARKERNKSTKTAHRQLDIAEERNQIASSKLDVLESWLKPPSQEGHQEQAQPQGSAVLSALADIEVELSRAQSSLDNIRRKVNSVDSRKAVISKNLGNLQARFMALRTAYPIVDDSPLEFNTGKILYLIIFSFHLMKAYRSLLHLAY